MQLVHCKIIRCKSEILSQLIIKMRSQTLRSADPTANWMKDYKYGVSWRSGHAWGWGCIGGRERETDGWIEKEQKGGGDRRKERM